MSLLLAALMAKTKELEAFKNRITPLYRGGSTILSGAAQAGPQEDPLAYARRLSDEADARQTASQADSEAYSRGKMLEQLGQGAYAQGNSYSDQALRNQLGMPEPGTVPAHPLENYLGGVTSQEDYRPAMLQYLSAGGRKPKWYTGNYEVDQPNIDAAVNASMTPQQQQVREEAQQKLSDLQDARQARIELAKEVEQRRAADSAMKREGLAQKNAIPNRDNRIQALNVLGGIIGDGFDKMPTQAQDAAAARAASIAKMKMGTPEAQGVDYESLLQDAYTEMLASGELKMPEQGKFFGLVGGHPASFKSQVGQNAQNAQSGQAPQQPEVPAIASPQAAPSAVPQVIKTKADYDALPPGALYIHPSDGKAYRKK